MQMYEEVQVLSPLVSTREFSFLRYCQQVEQGLWAITDVSVDLPREKQFAPSFSSKKLPSGCLIQEMPNGCSKVCSVFVHTHSHVHLSLEWDDWFAPNFETGNMGGTHGSWREISHSWPLQRARRQWHCIWCSALARNFEENVREDLMLDDRPGCLHKGTWWLWRRYFILAHILKNLKLIFSPFALNINYSNSWGKAKHDESIPTNGEQFLC